MVVFHNNYQEKAKNNYFFVNFVEKTNLWCYNSGNKFLGG